METARVHPQRDMTVAFQVGGLPLAEDASMAVAEDHVPAFRISPTWSMAHAVSCFFLAQDFRQLGA